MLEKEIKMQQNNILSIKYKKAIICAVFVFYRSITAYTVSIIGSKETY